MRIPPTVQHAQVSETSNRLRFTTLSVVVLLLALVQVGCAQTNPYLTNQVLAPPLYSGYSVAIPNAYLLHFTDWPFLTGTTGLPPNAGLQRVNGGANWNNIETARGTYSSTMGSLYFQWAGSCANVSGSGSNNGWVMAADCNNTNATITEGGSTRIAGNLLYTFNTVPGWASSGGSGWPVSAITVSCASGTCTVNLTINATGFTLNAGAQKDVVQITGLDTADGGASLNGTVTLTGVSGSGASTVITYTLSQGSRQSCPGTVSCTPTGGVVTYGASYPPSDIYTWTESCSGSDVYLGTTVKGDCYFREFVTKFMEHNCPNADGTPRNSIPGSPLYGGCAIHYFEGWNEFNADGYWEGNYTKLAEMMVDADEIIKQFCGDCYFIAGSVSAGGDGYHQYYTTGADGSAVYSEALGQLLHDWYYQTDATSPRYATPIYPDAISFHPYPSRDKFDKNDALPYPPMPESNLATGDTDSADYGCSPGNVTTSGINEPLKYSGTWTEPTTHLTCRDSVISATVEIQNVVSQLPTSYNFPAGLPVWNTESGVGPIFNSDQGTQSTTASSHDPYDDSLTAFLDQAYIARQSILTAASGMALNLWYQADNTLWGPLFYLPANQWLKNNSYGSGAFIWDGQSIQKCTAAGTSGGTFPSFNHSGGTTTDGTAVWTNVSTNWVANNSYGSGSLVWDGSHIQETNAGGTSGSSAPTWVATQGGKTTDNGVTWETVVADPHIVSGTSSHPVATPMGRTFNQVYAWFHGRNIQFSGIPGSSLKTYAHSAAFNTNDLVSQSGLLYRVAKAGTSGTSGPTWVQGMYNVLTDGGVTWELVGTSKCWDTSTFTGTLNSYGQGTVATQSVWNCSVSETVNGSGYTGNLVWYTPRDTSTPYAVPPGTNCIWDIDGNELSRKYPANMTVFNRPALIDNYVDSVCTAP
jgi:hypothetical protein